jgi:polar amino acid transport system substrate-binding protein
MIRFAKGAILLICWLAWGWTAASGTEPVMPQATPTVTPPATPQVTPQATPQATPQPAPESVLERVARTGVLIAGARTDASPFGYINAKGEWVGYSIDLLHLIQQALQRQLNREVQLQLVETNVSNWAPKLERQQIDLACGSISITSVRQLKVDFSIGYFRTGTQFLVKKAHQLSPPVFRVGVVRSASDEYSVEDGLQLAQVTRFSNRAAGLVALNAGQIDALASDGILLEGLRQGLPNPAEFEIMPPQPLNSEIYGCALPQNDPALRSLVNQTLLGFVQGVLNQNSQDVAIVDTWFGENGVAPVDRTQLLNFFRQLIKSHEQPPESSSQNPSQNPSAQPQIQPAQPQPQRTP